MTAVSTETSVIVMHTYKISVTESERLTIMNALNSPQAVVLLENNSNTCYFIITADETETFLTAASAFNSSPEKISISELKQKYSNSRYSTLRGNDELVSVLFQ